MFYRLFFVYVSTMQLIFSGSYLGILKFLSVIEIYIKMSEIQNHSLVSYQRRWCLHIWYSYLCQSLHILSIWCFLHYTAQLLQNWRLSTPLIIDGSRHIFALHYGVYVPRTFVLKSHRFFAWFFDVVKNCIYDSKLYLHPFSKLHDQFVSLILHVVCISSWCSFVQYSSLGIRY